MTDENLTAMEVLHAIAQGDRVEIQFAGTNEWHLVLSAATRDEGDGVVQVRMLGERTWLPVERGDKFRAHRKQRRTPVCQ